MKRYLVLWCISLALFVVDAGLLVYFIYNLSSTMMMICILSSLLAGILFRKGMNGITYEEGYTLIQAAQFYLKCKKAGLETEKMIKLSPEAFDKTAQAFDFAKDLTQMDRQVLFRRGKSFISKRFILK